jgi:hypothetical protein
VNKKIYKSLSNKNQTMKNIENCTRNEEICEVSTRERYLERIRVAESKKINYSQKKVDSHYYFG